MRPFSKETAVPARFRGHGCRMFLNPTDLRAYVQYPDCPFWFPVHRDDEGEIRLDDVE